MIWEVKGVLEGRKEEREERRKVGNIYQKSSGVRGGELRSEFIWATDIKQPPSFDRKSEVVNNFIKARL